MGVAFDQLIRSGQSADGKLAAFGRRRGVQVERGRLVGWLPRYRLPVKGHFAMVASCYFFEPTLGAKIWSRRLVLAFVRREARRYGTIDLLIID